ncbi:MAG: leucine-rich repeat protein [Clostridia bacterium]|nr:leucine-rich repeat protein [Clostridia bacterium]
MKKIVAFILCFQLMMSLFTFLPTGVFAGEDTGVCGDDLTWEFNAETGALTIFGTGKMYNYYPSISDAGSNITTAPWGIYCDSIKTVEITSGVESVGNYAFYWCTALENVTVPDSLTSISFAAFTGCSSLKCNDYDNAEYLGNTSNPYVALIKTTDSSVKSCKINDNTKIIGSNAFADCAQLWEIEIPDSVIGIGGGAFSNCNKLSEISLSNSITSIEDDTFVNCSNLACVTIPEGVVTIGNRAFSGCTSLYDVTIPDGVEEIKNEAFYNCFNLIAAVMPDSVTKLGQNAFKGCRGLLSVELSNNLGSIEDGTFYDCRSLSGVTIPNGVTQIGWGAFACCTDLKQVLIHDSITRILGGVFDESSLTDIYYSGTEEQWGNVIIFPNDKLPEVTIHYNTDIIDHVWDDGIVLKAETCVKRGIMKYTCTVCGEIKAQIIPAPGHSYSDEYTIEVEPTETTVGYKARHCTICSNPGYFIMIPKIGTVMGDSNGDGRVDMRDVLLMRKHILNIIKLTGNAFPAADMDENGMINMKDVLAVRKKILNIH